MACYLLLGDIAKAVALTGPFGVRQINLTVGFETSQNNQISKQVRNSFETSQKTLSDLTLLFHSAENTIENYTILDKACTII